MSKRTKTLSEPEQNTPERPVLPEAFRKEFDPIDR